MTAAKLLYHPKFFVQPRGGRAKVRCVDCAHTLAPPDALGTMALCALDGLPRITSIERECVEFERAP